MSAKQTKGAWGWHGEAVTEGLSLSKHYNPPVSSADSPLYTRGPFPVPTIILQITLRVCKRQEIIPQDLLFQIVVLLTKKRGEIHLAFAIVFLFWEDEGPIYSVGGLPKWALKQRVK